jgi:hypothetical protein
MAGANCGGRLCRAAFLNILNRHAVAKDRIADCKLPERLGQRQVKGRPGCSRQKETPVCPICTPAFLTKPFYLKELRPLNIDRSLVSD